MMFESAKQFFSVYKYAPFQNEKHRKMAEHMINKVLQNGVLYNHSIHTIYGVPEKFQCLPDGYYYNRFEKILYHKAGIYMKKTYEHEYRNEDLLFNIQPRYIFMLDRETIDALKKVRYHLKNEIYNELRLFEEIENRRKIRWNIYKVLLKNNPSSIIPNTKTIRKYWWQIIR